MGDGESGKLPCRWSLAHRSVFDMPGQSPFDAGLEAVQFVGRSFSDDFDPSIGEVPDVSRHGKPSGYLLGGISKPDPLNMSREEDDVTNRLVLFGRVIGHGVYGRRFIKYTSRPQSRNSTLSI